MASSKHWILIPGLGALAAAALLVAALSREGVLHSDPAALRESNDYDRMLGPANTLKAIKPSVFDSFELSTNETSLELTYQRSDSASYDFAKYTVHHVSADHRFAVPEGSILLDGIGVAYMESSGDANRGSVSVPARFFHPDSQLFSEQEVEKRLPKEWDRNNHISKPFPAATFLFSVQGLKERKVLEAALFDARTHKRLSSGYSFDSANKSSMQLKLGMRMWHTGPVELVITLALGEVEEFRIRPEVGETIDVGKGKLRLVGIGDGIERQWNSTSNGMTNSMSIEFSQDSDGRGVTFVFVLFPGAAWIPVDLEFLDESGEPFRTAGSGRSGEVLLASVRAEREEVARIRIKHYPTVQRLVFHLPEIPGLPAGNRAVENLFDVIIPFARVSAEYEFRNLISDTVQMPIRPYISPNMPAGYFPRTFTNTTARSLLDEYLEYMPDHRLLRIDEEKNTIVLEPPFAVRLLRRIQQLLR